MTGVEMLGGPQDAGWLQMDPGKVASSGVIWVGSGVDRARYWVWRRPDGTPVLVWDQIDPAEVGWDDLFVWGS